MKKEVLAGGIQIIAFSLEGSSQVNYSEILVLLKTPVDMADLYKITVLSIMHANCTCSSGPFGKLSQGSTAEITN